MKTCMLLPKGHSQGEVRQIRHSPLGAKFKRAPKNRVININNSLVQYSKKTKMNAKVSMMNNNKNKKIQVFNKDRATITHFFLLLPAPHGTARHGLSNFQILTYSILTITLRGNTIVTLDFQRRERRPREEN